MLQLPHKKTQEDTRGEYRSNGIPVMMRWFPCYSIITGRKEVTKKQRKEDQDNLILCSQHLSTSQDQQSGQKIHFPDLPVVDEKRPDKKVMHV